MLQSISSSLWVCLIAHPPPPAQDSWCLLKQQLLGKACAVFLPALLGVHPLFSRTRGRAAALLKRVKVPFSRSLHTLLLTAWRAKGRKAGSGSYLLRYSGFPLHPHPVSACSPSGLRARELSAHQIT